MAFKLDDFLSKKKEPAQVLDLSRVKITSKEEFKKYLDKVPEFKIKPEKVTAESIKIRDKDFTFSPGKREEKQMREWSFPDPTPPDMRSVKLEDLCPVNIDWKMLTTLRPKTKVEEEMFSRLVQLGKLDLKYQQALLREKPTDWIRKTKNPRSSIVEVRVLSCKECGEDFCDGSLCSKLTYDNFSRGQAGTSGEVMKNFKLPDQGKSSKKKKTKRKSRKRTRTRPRRVKPRKNSIFNRPATRGCSRDHSRRGSHAKAENARSSSLNRISPERKPAFLQLKRSKSAPRLQAKRETSDPMFACREYASDSAPTQTDYSSQSDTESSRSPVRKSSSTRVGFVEDYDSDSGECSSAGRRRRHRRRCSLPPRCSDSDAPDSDRHESNESLHESPKASRPSSKYPTTIQIKFDGFQPTSSVFFPRKSYARNAFGGGPPRRGEVAALRNQEVTRIMEGFAKIDLSFTEEEASTSRHEGATVSPKRVSVSSRISRSRTRSDRESFPSTSYIRGQGIFAKNFRRE